MNKITNVLYPSQTDNTPEGVQCYAHKSTFPVDNVAYFVVYEGKSAQILRNGFRVEDPTLLAAIEADAISPNQYLRKITHDEAAKLIDGMMLTRKDEMDVSLAFDLALAFGKDAIEAANALNKATASKRIKVPLFESEFIESSDVNVVKEPSSN